MSQSDYIRHRKLTTVVKHQTTDFRNPIPRQTLDEITGYMVTKTVQPVNEIKSLK
jgi:hypothetical protein